MNTLLSWPNSLGHHSAICLRLTVHDFCLATTQPQKQQLRAQRHADSLPAIERDRLYNQILNQLPLHPEDRADLHRRGITDEQIKTWGIRSVEPW
jgi:hypothetical protein